MITAPNRLCSNSLQIKILFDSFYATGPSIIVNFITSIHVLGKEV